MIYAFYIFDRHSKLIYYRNWHSKERTLRGTAISSSSRRDLSLSDEAKLVYGVVISLRNMARRLGSEYATSYFDTNC